MNNFLERQTNLLGGPKPRGWNTSGGSSKNGSPVKGSPPAALPSGGGLPVFEKRVQLKEHLPHCAARQSRQVHCDRQQSECRHKQLAMGLFSQHRGSEFECE